MKRRQMETEWLWVQRPPECLSQVDNKICWSKQHITLSKGSTNILMILVYIHTVLSYGLLCGQNIIVVAWFDENRPLDVAWKEFTAHNTCIG